MGEDVKNRLSSIRDDARVVISTLLTLVIILSRVTGTAEKILRIITDEIDPAMG